jgi:hypothetical protein
VDKVDVVDRVDVVDGVEAVNNVIFDPGIARIVVDLVVLEKTVQAIWKRQRQAKDFVVNLFF